MKYYLVDNMDKFYVFDEDTAVLTCVNENCIWPISAKNLSWNLDIEKDDTTYENWFRNPWWSIRQLKIILPQEAFVEMLCNE